MLNLVLAQVETLFQCYHTNKKCILTKDLLGMENCVKLPLRVMRIYLNLVCILPNCLSLHLVV